MSSKRVAMSQEEALWLYNLIQRTILRDLLEHQAVTDDFAASVNLIRRIKHIAEV